eukprot:359416-Chlamydomonas_euryale.AAC.8
MRVTLSATNAARGRGADNACQVSPSMPWPLCFAYLLLVARRQQRQHIASWRCSGQLKSSADVIALVHRLVVVRRGSRVLAVYQEVVVHSQVSKVMHCRRHDDAKHFKFGNVFELFLEAGQDDRAGLCHVGRVDGVVVRVVQILGLHAPQEAFHSTPV